MAAGSWSASGGQRMLPEGTVTFLLTDVEGSTRLWESAPEMMPEVIARHYELLDAAITEHGGLRPQEQGEGDSVVGVFSDARAAVAAAVEAQRTLAAEPFAGSVMLRVRMALHSGVATKRDALNYAGPVIIRCARLRACAHGRQIVVSDATAALVRDRLADDLSLVSLGRHRLKDLDVPEHVHQVIAPGLETVFPPLRSLQPDRHNLPLQSTPLVGRRDDIAQLLRLIECERIVTLTGSGGVGKTRLALQLAAEAVEFFEGGAWWVDLATLTESQAVPAAVLSAVGGVQQPFTTALDQLVTLLRPESAVLVLLDNCEHVAGGCATVVETLTTHCAGVTVLATSREPVGVRGEITWRVASLSLPAPDTDVGVAEAANFEALALFWDRALRARPQLALTDALIDASVRICQRLDGIALAIELAAARCRQLSPERIAREVEDHYRLIAGGGRTQLPRQRTLDASVDWSHRLLDEPEQLVFRRLGVFVGWFPLDAAEGVISAFGDIDAWSVLELVTRLVDKSLLTVDDETNPAEPRYRMLETVRFYALERAQTANELEDLREAHALWWSNWIRAFNVRPHHSEAVYPNLREALQWLAPTPERAAPLVRSLAQWMAIIGQADDFRNLLIPIANALHATRHRAWARTVAWMSTPAIMIGEIDFMLGPVTEALSVAEQSDDTDTVAACLGGLAFLDPTAERWTRLAAFDEHTHGAICLMGRAAVHAQMPNDVRDDRDALASVLASAKRANMFHLQYALLGLALVDLVLGDLAAAGRYCDEAHRVIDLIGAAPATRLSILAVDAATGLARADGSRVAEIKRRRDARLLRGVPRFWAGPFGVATDIASYHLAGTGLDSEQLIAAATAPLAATPWHGAYTLISQELADRRLGEPLQSLHAALAATPFANGPYHRMQRTAMRARLAEIDRDLALEETEWRDLAPLAVEQGARPMAIEALEGIAMLTANTAPARSARLFAAAQSARDAITYRFRFPREQQRVDDAHAAIAAALAEDAMADALGHGASMSLEEAAAYAQRTRGPRLRPTLGWESLTPTEREVARLVAEGATNPDIGRKLVMSVNTVKTHVGHIYTKLDITSRAQLAAILTRTEYSSD